MRTFCYTPVMNDKLRTFLCGLAMGAADVVPGISGGTIAFITGVYTRLFKAIEAIDYTFFSLLLRFRPREAMARIPWGFLLPLVCGIAISIFSLARGVTYTIQTWPLLVWSFFFGLVVAAVFILGKELRLPQTSTWLAFFTGAIIGWLVGGADPLNIGHSMAITFASGFVAICAMVLPGISGAFVLVLLDQYAYVMAAVNNLDFSIISVFVLGCLAGIMSFARVLSRMLKQWPNGVMAVLTGLMAGSLRKVWPWQEGTMPAIPPSGSEAAIGLAFCLIGVSIPIALTVIAKTKVSTK